MRPVRLNGMAGIGVDRMGRLADASQDSNVLRLENLDTDLPPPPGVMDATREAVLQDSANSYLPFLGTDELRQEAARLVSRLSGVEYDWNETTVITAGGLSGILNVLLAILEPGDEVLIPDPVYIGLINRILLAGGVPVLVPCDIVAGVWRLNIDRLRQSITSRTRAFLMMSPVMPSGAVFTRDDWEAICKVCRDAGSWLIHNSAMARILYDGVEPVHPAAFPGMADRTIIAGSISKEYRMIGWRIGWITAPPSVINDIGLVTISNTVCPVGIAQKAAAVALRSPESDLAAAVAVWQDRRDLLLKELAGFPIVKPQGGWSLLMDVSPFGVSAEEASQRLLERGRIAATAMTGWGSERSSRFVRFVFSNEPASRLKGIGARVEASFQ